MQDKRRNISVRELESAPHFPNLLEDKDFVLYYSLRDR